MILRGVEACVNVIHRRCQVTRECPKRLAVENFQADELKGKTIIVLDLIP